MILRSDLIQMLSTERFLNSIVHFFIVGFVVTGHSPLFQLGSEIKNAIYLSMLVQLLIYINKYFSTKVSRKSVVRSMVLRVFLSNFQGYDMALLTSNPNEWPRTEHAYVLEPLHMFVLIRCIYADSLTLFTNSIVSSVFIVWQSTLSTLFLLYIYKLKEKVIQKNKHLFESAKESKINFFLKTFTINL